MDKSKYSLPGEFVVVPDSKHIPRVFPKEAGSCMKSDLLKTVYDCGPVEGFQWDSFDCIRERVSVEWKRLPRVADPITPELRQKMTEAIEENKVKTESLSSNSL